MSILARWRKGRAMVTIPRENLERVAEMLEPLTVIIPSRNAVNLKACIAAVREHEPAADLIIVDDGDTFDRKTAEACGVDLWRDTVLTGAAPFIFARNVNLGIRAAGVGDVVILNDDAILETPGGFSAMQQSAADHPDVAIVSATTNISSSPEQYPRKKDAHRPEPFPLRITRLGPIGFPSIAFVCVLIPARTLETIGLLDERFTGYGWEDVDYCRRIHEAGQLIGIDDRCFVDHSKLTSTFRGAPRAPGPIEEGRRIYLDKWGKA